MPGEIGIRESREAMIYVNSVNNIIQIIKKFNLSSEEVTILCSNTKANLERIQNKLGKNFNIGKVPLKNEERKMFTFCTRTVYLGADFYSDNARSFILSDANLETLAVDISLDLPQILGRQRNEDNPWKNQAEFYYKPYIKVGKEESKEVFQQRISRATSPEASQPASLLCHWHWRLVFRRLEELTTPRQPAWVLWQVS